MGLQVWLPLNGNLNNQGVANVVVTNGGTAGAVSDDNGKIGKCYSFGTGLSYLNVPQTPFQTFTEFSFCCWVNIISWNTNYSTIFAAKNSTGSSWNNLIFSLLRNGSSSKLVFNISNGSSYTSTSCTTGTLSINTWYHIVCTYETGEIKLYVNGDNVSTYSTSIVPAFSSIANFFIGASANNVYQSNVKLNDVRIYNNCLSAEEIKEISRGLVLHYPLDKNGWGQDNLVTNTNFTSSSISSMAVSNAVNLGQWKRESSNVTLAMDGEYVKLHYETNTSRYGIHYEISLDPGTYTYSITAGGRMTCSFGLATSWPSTNIITANSPGRYSKTFTVSETATYRMYIYTTSANPNIWFNWPKLEVGDKSTPWAPNSADVLYTTMGISNSIEYDASGYQYNGTRNSTFTWRNISPKYNISTKFTGTNYISLTSPTAEAKTLSIWVKWDTIPSGQSVVFLDYKSKLGLGLMSTGILCGTSGPGNFYTFSKSSLVANTWYHFVVVNTGTATSTTRDLYINGIKQTQTSSTSNWSYNVDQTQIGKRNSTSDGFVGLLSDVRIYATALSADDIKSLYESNRL